ncbi:22653_t:CDS:2 [Gigaspora margarita]|uniref:22653_t:CDS:1 n=1 Tax=Gigaspora margarita TaxID=4874 RepID=A0ABM8W6N1_GIGMA|nr:22653_t:CDS:2 [Gigaspora margarita]
MAKKDLDNVKQEFKKDIAEMKQEFERKIFEMEQESEKNTQLMELYEQERFERLSRQVYTLINDFTNETYFYVEGEKLPDSSLIQLEEPSIVYEEFIEYEEKNRKL